MNTLYELTSDYLAVLEMMDDPDVDPQVIQDTLEGIDGEIEIKADGYAKVIRELDGRAKALKAEEDRLALRRKTIENNMKNTKERLQSAMMACGKTKFKTDLFSFGIQKNPPSLVVDDESQIPPKYWIPQDPVVDKTAIKEALKAGEEIAFAHLEQGESLRIR